MAAAEFYSARLLFIVLVADGPGKKRNLHDECVVVFKAKNSDHAFKRALDIGRKAEHQYRNDKGHLVRWVLVRVLNLDWVGATIEGKEVSSVLHDRVDKKVVRPNTKFHPEKTEPLWR